MRFKIPMFVLVFSSLSGCMGSATVSEDTVLTVATNDMDCPKQKLKAAKITDNNWKVSGCARKFTYLCSGSNFMTDGFCVKN